MTDDTGNRGAGCRTIRQQVFSLLVEADRTAQELSKILRIFEKDVVQHLAHIGKTAAAQEKRLVIRPFQCRSCGYRFKDRKRFTRPGRCPNCKGTHLETPVFRIS